MRSIEKEFPNIINFNGLPLEDVTLKSLTDDKYLDSKELIKNVKFAQRYIVDNISEYGDEPTLKKALYIHTPERSILSFIFKGKENFNYQAIVTREGEGDGLDLRYYFIMKNESDMILKLRAKKNGEEFGEVGSQGEPRDRNLYQEVEEILDYINSAQNENE